MIALLAALNISCNNDWLDRAAKRANQEALSWVKEQLHKDADIVRVAKDQAIHIESPPAPHKQCTTAASTRQDSDAPVYVMISFSVPEETWISLSSEMEKIGAVFVLRGLPNNSFKELSLKIQRLRTLGVNAEVRIDPRLFTTYSIKNAPTFLIIEKDDHLTLSGNVSLAYALETMRGKL